MYIWKLESSNALNECIVQLLYTKDWWGKQTEAHKSHWYDLQISSADVRQTGQDARLLEIHGITLPFKSLRRVSQRY